MNRRILFVTTRDIAEPRTGADNRASAIVTELREMLSVDPVYFERSEGDHDWGTSVSSPSTELFAILSLGLYWAVVRNAVSHQYDIVVISTVGAVPYGVLAAILTRSPLVFDDHNVEHQVARYEGGILRFLVVTALERVGCHLAAVVVVPTEQTADALGPWISGKTLIIANGYDAETFCRDGPTVDFEAPSVLFFGNYAYGPNREAATYIVNQLSEDLDRIGAAGKIYLAGPDLDSVLDGVRLPERVEALGFVEDLSAAIRSVDAVVVPLTAGSGSRLKIIESLACGTPVVATPVGAEGWPEDWQNLRITDREQFPTMVQTVLQEGFDDSEYDEVTAYSWQAQCGPLRDCLRSLLMGASL